MESYPKGPDARPTPLVLVVDDEESVRLLLRRILELEGFAVVEAASAEEGMQRLQTSRPAVAFCDVHLKGENGLWLADQIRGCSPATAIVLATGDVKIPPTESLRSGVVSYLVKPFSRETVCKAARSGVRWSDAAMARNADRQKRRQGTSEPGREPWEDLDEFSS